MPLFGRDYLLAAHLICTYSIGVSVYVPRSLQVQQSQSLFTALLIHGCCWRNVCLPLTVLSINANIKYTFGFSTPVGGGVARDRAKRTQEKNQAMNILCSPKCAHTANLPIRAIHRVSRVEYVRLCDIRVFGGQLLRERGCVCVNRTQHFPCA